MVKKKSRNNMKVKMGWLTISENGDQVVWVDKHGSSYLTCARYRPHAGAIALAAVTVFAFRILSTAKFM